jgi:hypothetical protein
MRIPLQPFIDLGVRTHGMGATRYELTGVPFHTLHLHDPDLLWEQPERHVARSLAVDPLLRNHGTGLRLTVLALSDVKPDTTVIVTAERIVIRTPIFSFRAKRHPTSFDAGALERYVGSVWRQRYTHLTAEQFRGALESVTAEFDPTRDRADVHRLADRTLYRVSVENGWKKLGPKERERLGITTAKQWWPQEELASFREVER